MCAFFHFWEIFIVCYNDVAASKVSPPLMYYLQSVLTLRLIANQSVTFDSTNGSCIFMPLSHHPHVFYLQKSVHLSFSPKEDFSLFDFFCLFSSRLLKEWILVTGVRRTTNENILMFKHHRHLCVPPSLYGERK